MRNFISNSADPPNTLITNPRSTLIQRTKRFLFWGFLILPKAECFLSGNFLNKYNFLSPFQFESPLICKDVKAIVGCSSLKLNSAGVHINIKIYIQFTEKPGKSEFCHIFPLPLLNQHTVYHPFYEHSVTVGLLPLKIIVL